MITQKEIAEELGISRTTVARAINGSPSIKKETKEKIMKLVEKYNYEKNYIGSTLAIKTKKVIYALVVKSKNEFYTDGIYNGLLKVEKEFKHYNMAMEIIQTDINDEELQLRKLKEILLKDNIGGLIITPLAKEKIYKILKPYLETMKIISLGMRLHKDIPHVGPDYKKMGKIAGEIMRNILRDEERLLVIDNGDDKVSSKSYLEGFISKIKDTQIKIVGPIKGKNAETTVEIIEKYCTEDRIDGIYINRYSHDSLKKVQKKLLIGKKIVTNGMDETIKKLIKSKIITATVMEQVELEGYTAGKKIFDSIIKNQTMENRWEVLKSRIVFLENLPDEIE